VKVGTSSGVLLWYHSIQIYDNSCKQGTSGDFDLFTSPFNMAWLNITVK
jgi:hypothetical protein